MHVVLVTDLEVQLLQRLWSQAMWMVLQQGYPAEEVLAAQDGQGQEVGADQFVVLHFLSARQSLMRLCPME